MQSQNQTTIQLSDIEQVLGEQIGFESSKAIEPPWTESYREGYVDGLKQALDCIRELVSEPDGCFPVTSLHRDDLEQAGFETDGIDDAVMTAIAENLGECYTENGFWSDLAVMAEYFGVPGKPC